MDSKPLLRTFSRVPWKRLFCCPDNEGEKGKEDPMVKRILAKERLTQTYWALVTMASAFLLTLQPVLAADDIWSKFTEMMKDIYGKLAGISTIVAVTAAAVALLVRMISRNQRAVDEASSWLKRIIVAWIVLNTLGFAVAYLAPLVDGGKYTP